MDTDTLVKNAMKADQAKLDKLYQSKTKLEWKRDAYTEVNSLVSAFTNKFMSTLSADNMFSVNTYKAFKISMPDKYKTYFDISGTAAAAISRHTITKTTLAEYATVNGAKYRNRVAGLSGTTNANSQSAVTGTKKLAADWQTTELKDLKYADGSSVFTFSSSTDNLSFSVNGQRVVIGQDETMQDVIDAVNGNPAAKAKMSVTADGEVRFESTVKGAETKLEFGNVAGPEVFGKNGAFGITDLSIKPKSLINENMTLDQIAAATGKDLGFDSNGKISFKINGETFEFSKSDTLKDVMDTINSNANAKVKMSYDQGQDAFMLRSTVTGAGTEVSTENVTGNFFGDKGLTAIKEDTTTKYQTIDRNSDTIASAASKMGVNLQTDENGKFSFTVNGVDFSFNTTDTLQTMINKVNGDPNAKARLSYSQITDSFVFTSSETGRDATVTVANKGNSNAFGGDASFFGTAEATARGTDATIEIDGETITQSSNKFVLDGIQFDLKVAFDSTDPAKDLEALSFTVDQDIDKVVDKVKKFVEEYNKLTQSLHALINEKIDYDYSPLTEAQRNSEDMSEKEIEKWDTEAKKGILRNDSTINGMLSSLRKNLFEKVGDTGLSPSDLGFSTIAYTQGQYGGQIEFNETKFREMMAKDPEAVATVMAGTSSSTNAEQIYAQSGFISRAFDQMSEFKNTIRSTNLKNTNQKITDTSEAMTNQLARMYEAQERLYIQFARMEQLQAQFQQQSSWLSQQLGAL